MKWVNAQGQDFAILCILNQYQKSSSESYLRSIDGGAEVVIAGTEKGQEVVAKVEALYTEHGVGHQGADIGQRGVRME